MALIRPKRNDIFLYMRMLYLRTEKSVVNELKRQQENGLVDYGTYAALMRVQQTLQEMQDESFTYVPEMVNKVFRDANARAGYEAAEALSVAQTAIVEQLTGNLLGCITEAAEQAYKTSESILQLGRLHPDVFRNPVLLSSALAEAEGRGMSPAVTRALHSLQNDNITSFVDKSGREWGLTEYCTMATRTVRTQATVAANLTSDDWDLWKITPNGSTCALCAAYEGRVYSKSGTNPDYPPLSAAFGKIDPAGGNDLSNTYLNIHPNCLHSLVRYTTAGRTDEEIQKDKDFSSFEKRPADVDYRTKKQIEEYREKERKRAEFLATRRQWNDYRERLGIDIPSLETFEKHKKAGDDKYKAWEKAYRKKGAELRKENPELFEKKPTSTPKAPAIPQIESYGQASDFLVKDVGFDAVEPSFAKIDKSLAVSNANQLMKLESRFGIIHESTGTICSVSNGKANAYVSHKRSNPTEQTLSLCPGAFKTRQGLVDSSMQTRESRWHMPFVDANADIYSVTHEYGHMIQNFLLRREYIRLGWSADAPRAFVDTTKKTANARFKWYIKAEENFQNQCYNELIGIAKQKNPDFSLADNLSRYGRTNKAEFFAEVFANSQLGNPNELGLAMIEWLKQKGF